MSAELPKILVVDDFVTNLNVIGVVLAQTEAEIINARSGPEALGLALQHDFALILLDVNMPLMDGYEVAQILSSSRVYSSIPIIFISASVGDPAHRKLGYESGAIDFIQKPIEEDVLVSKVNIFLDLYNQKRHLELLRDDLEARVDERTSELQRTQKLARVGGWSVDLKNKTERICPTARELFFSNNSSESPSSKPVISFFHALQDSEQARVHDLFQMAYKDQLNEVEFEFEFLDENNCQGTAFSVATVTFENGAPIAIHGSVMDITERKMAQESLQYTATHDALTGLPNRYLFKDRLDQAFLRADRSGGSVAILLLDLDYFKDINDTLGHPAGDKLLTEVGHRLLEIARASDTVARLGGDEFAIICADMKDSEYIGRVAQRCISSLEKPYDINDSDVLSGCSIGIALYPNDGDNADELTKHADLALYQSKANGRNAFQLYDKEMSANIVLRKERENRLHLALDQNEFVLHYQPQITLDTKEVVGVEALIRWAHPDEGLVPPNDFISLAEETGLIHDLGEWVIKEACQTAARWRSIHGHRLKMAVNVSALQLRSDAFVGNVARILGREYYPGRLLEIEVTESAIFSDPEKTQATLDELRDMGITIALDDFGTGYSSLTHLKHLRASTLKIDRSFISNILEDHNDLHIAEKMIELAQKLKMKVVAEGIETLAQMDRLMACSCDIGQGYLFSRPLPEKEFLAWLEEYEALQTPSALEAG